MTQLQYVRPSRSQASPFNPRRVRQLRRLPSHASMTSTIIWSATPGRKPAGPGKLAARLDLSARLALGLDLEDKVRAREQVPVRERRLKLRHVKRNL